MKWKRFLAIVLAGALLFSMGACKKNETDDSSSAPSEPEEVVDPNYPVSIGDIHVDARPETIVSLSPAMTELICALGAGDRDRKSTRLNSSHRSLSRMPSSA